MPQLEGMNTFAGASLPAKMMICVTALLAGTGICVHLAQGAPKSPTVELPETMRPPPPRPVDSNDKQKVAIAVPTAKPAVPRQHTDEVLPEKERACRGKLSAMGVTFSEQPRIEDEGECGIAFPIEVSSLASDVELTPKALMNCETAEAAARLARDTIRPAAKKRFGANLSGIRQASAYVCRIRVGGSKIS